MRREEVGLSMRAKTMCGRRGQERLCEWQRESACRGHASAKLPG